LFIETHIIPSLKAHVCVTSYDMVQKMDVEMVKRYGVIVVDESHCLKSRDTKRTQVRSGAMVSTDSTQ